MQSLRGKVALLAITSAALFGCAKNEMPGVAGKVSLGKDVDPNLYRTLEIRAMAVNDELDPNDVRFPTETAEDIYTKGTAGARVYSGETRRDPPEGAVFVQIDAVLGTFSWPHPYWANGEGGEGYSQYEHWRVFAWLSNFDDSQHEVAPPSGSPYGVVDFDLDPCPSGGSFCGVTQGVDVTMDRVAP